MTEPAHTNIPAGCDHKSRSETKKIDWYALGKSINLHVVRILAGSFLSWLGFVLTLRFKSVSPRIWERQISFSRWDSARFSKPKSSFWADFGAWSACNSLPSLESITGHSRVTQIPIGIDKSGRNPGKWGLDMVWLQDRECTHSYIRFASWAPLTK